jgi:methionyl-tRNA synthetase
VPQPGPLTHDDKRLLDQADALLEISRGAMKEQAIHQMLNAIWAVVADANRYFAASAPWDLRKTDPARMGTVLWLTAEVIRQVAILAQPVMPASCEKLLDLLGIDADQRAFTALATRIKAGTQLPTPTGVFPRYVEPAAAS